MILTAYGKSSGFCVDPIEKKPLYHFLPGTGVLSFGTIGCNLGCKFCQNWHISKPKNDEQLSVSASPSVIAKAAHSLGCRSVAFTYNEPAIFAEYVQDVALACRDLGIKTVAVTAGYMHEKSRAEFYANIDAANVDLKSFSDTFYEKLTSAKLQPVLDTLIYLKKSTNVWLEVTTLLIPGENDSAEEIHALTEWVAGNLGVDTPLHFSAFHPDFLMSENRSTSLATLLMARGIAIEKGLRYVYTGNVRDPRGSATYCHNCKKLLIGRDGFAITEYNLNEKGECAFCQTKCSGQFDPHPGKWGPYTMPVNLEK